MKHFFLLFFLGFATATCQGQVKIIVEQIPSHTPRDAKIYLAGNFNAWNPADEQYLLKPNASGQYEISLGTIQKNIEFKFTQGSWESVEQDSLNRDIPNRTLNLEASTTVYFRIQAWKKTGEVASSASSNVKIIQEDFEIPQLMRKRRIWIYLPPSYEKSKKKYPVLYAHDGQNLFDARTSYAGEWELDETLNKLFKNPKNPEIIVVGIDNGQQHRMNEYSPWTHPQYGGGEGDAYVDFIVKNLKPYIDQNYRTKANTKHTGMMGSSMGGLISFYAALKYPQVFGLVGVLSPSFWFSEEVFQLAKDFNSGYQPRFYFLVGEKEGAIMVDKTAAMYQLLQSKGYPSEKMKYSVIPDGEHKEWLWGQEFPKVFAFLYPD